MADPVMPHPELEPLAHYSRDGLSDTELLDATAFLLSALNDRFSRDGEYRGGSDAADEIERTCDHFDAFASEEEPWRERSVERTGP